MKKNCGIIFAGVFFVLLQRSIAQDADKKPPVKAVIHTWRYYDSLAVISAFNRDTILALENYKMAVALNPGNELLRKNYEKLSRQFIKSNQSFYNINP